MQRLVDLHTGESAFISKIKGRGAFRRRLSEMGFVRGKEIKVIKNAPLLDPIEYSILGYKVSLRRSEAAMIIVSDKEMSLDTLPVNFNEPGKLDNQLIDELRGKGKVINIALVGNPNAGKTTIFNYASSSNEHTGNYSGVTVNSKTAQIKHDGYVLNITDLPGTYSISALSPEELFVRDFILNEVPDVVVNIVDASNLERNLLLTTQLIDMDVKVVLALNMYDELEKSNSQLNHVLLGKLLGAPIMPTIGAKGRGIKELFQKVVNVYNDTDSTQRHIHINYGTEPEKSINAIQEKIKLKENWDITDKISSRFIAIKLLEGDNHIEQYFINAPNYKEIKATAFDEVERIEQLLNDDPNTLITDAKYGFIGGALKETYKPGAKEKREVTDILDAFLTHKLFGFPIFFFFLWLMFSATFYLGAYPMAWIESGVGLLSDFISNNMNNGSLKDLMVDGIIGGVGGVIVFLPNILLLFLFISFMEDSGYMARTVFIMDKVMHKIGLHGKSFISLIMGFGCNVPAIMATRTIEDRNNRLLTILINPFMSCSARLPVYLLIIGAVFPNNRGTILFSIYIFGIALAVAMALLFKKKLIKGEDTPFVMELPPYRMPTLRSTLKHMWWKGSQYLKKMGGIILIASIVLWALGYFPRNISYSEQLVQKERSLMDLQQKSDFTPDEQQNYEQKLKELEHQKETERLENSYIGKMGKFIEPAIRPLGFDWKMGISLVTGIAAKEVVVSTIGVLYQASEDDLETGLTTKLRNETYKHGKFKGKKMYNPITSISFLLFTLIYFPCIAVIAAIRRETGSNKWAVFIMLYTTGLAWLVSFVFFSVGKLFI